MSINRPASIVVAATLLCGLVFGLINGAFASRSAIATAAVIRSERPAVDVMFVLDTTSSMTGLIAAAKDKIWSIANTLASAGGNKSEAARRLRITRKTLREKLKRYGLLE